MMSPDKRINNKFKWAVMLKKKQSEKKKNIVVNTNIVRLVNAPLKTESDCGSVAYLDNSFWNRVKT